MSVSRLDRKYWTCNFNFEMIMAVVTHFGETDTIDVYGHFRSKKDLGAIIWEAKDTWSHATQVYPKSNDYTGVVWSFSIALTGDLKGLDAVFGPTLTVYLTDGSYKYVRLWNYAQTGRTATAADIILDFDAMSAGWDADDPIDPRYIERLSISFCHEDYDGGNTTTPLAASAPFHVEFTNWSVTGGSLGDDPAAQAAHDYRLADGYDNNYAVTPERFVDHFYNLGFRESINLYLGTSHFYDKVAPTPLTAGDYTEYRYELDPAVILNDAAEAWLADFLLRAADVGYTRIIMSVGLELVDCPSGWEQKAYDGTAARTGWTPAPYVIDAFCHADAQDYYKALALKLCELQDDAGLTPCYQLGESWWWTQDSMPCFYGDATKAAFFVDYGYNPEEFETVFDDFTGYEATIAWMQDKNGDYAHLLRDHLKATYASAEFTVLFFPPSVVDPVVAGEMMGIANYPTTHWASPELDFFQVEDYDWLINNDLDQHYGVWSMITDDLGYSLADIQYFAGFVLLPTQTRLWRRINHAAKEALCRGFMDSFIWAGTQIRRDDWAPLTEAVAGYLLWWKDFTAKEEALNYLADYSGWMNDGALAGAAAFEDIPARGKVVTLANSGDYARSTVCGDQYVLSAFTLEAWINVSTPHDADIVLREESLQLSLENGVPAVAFYDGSDWVQTVGDIAVNYDSWNHLAGVYDGNDLTIYLNGAEVGTGAATGSTPDNDNDFVVGYSVGRQFYGKIAEVVVKDAASTAAQVFDDLKRWLWREYLDVVELVEVWTPYQTDPFCYCSAKAALTVTSYDHLGEAVTYTYNPLGFERSGIKREMIGSQQQTTISIAATTALQELVRDYDIRGYKIGAKMTYRSVDHTNPDNVLQVFLGQVLQWSLRNAVLEITARDNTIDLGGQVPPAYFDYFCRHFFKRNRCQYLGAATECTKTETACLAFDNAIHFGGFKFVPRLMRRRGV